MANYKTGSQRYNDRMDKIWEQWRENTKKENILVKTTYIAGKYEIINLDSKEKITLNLSTRGVKRICQILSAETANYSIQLITQ